MQTLIEVRSFFLEIVAEFVIVARKNHQAVPLLWREKAEKRSTWGELFEGKVWDNGFYRCAMLSWRLSAPIDDCNQCGAILLTERGQIIHQEMCIAQDEDDENFQIKSSLMDIACTSIEAFLITCEELIGLADSFGIERSKVDEWAKEMELPRRPHLYEVK